MWTWSKMTKMLLVTPGKTGVSHMCWGFFVSFIPSTNLSGVRRSLEILGRTFTLSGKAAISASIRKHLCVESQWDW